MARIEGIGMIEVEAMEARNLDTVCYRGDAPVAHLALISQADVFDQVTNPEGLQRDLSPSHAVAAYDYAGAGPRPQRPRAYPEIVLNVRDRKAIEIAEIAAPEGLGRKLVRLRFNIEKMKDGKVYVSRVDGNHRLAHAAGDKSRDPLLVNVPFQIHIGLTREQERSLFVDINSNQKGMNTSHLAVMQTKLTPEESEIKDHLDRWIATKLTHDPASPWHGLVHLGGSKKGTRTQGLTRTLNFASIQSGVYKMLQKSLYLHDMTDPQAQYLVIRNYWAAVKQAFASEWANPKDYLLLRNIGVWSLSYLGGSIIDRCIARGRVDVADLASYLQQAHGRFDWVRDAPPGERTVAGMTGNKAAMILAGAMAEELSDDTGTATIKELQERLLSKVD